MLAIVGRLECHSVSHERDRAPASNTLERARHSLTSQGLWWRAHAKVAGTGRHSPHGVVLGPGAIHTERTAVDPDNSDVTVLFVLHPIA